MKIKTRGVLPALLAMVSVMMLTGCLMPVRMQGPEVSRLQVVGAEISLPGSYRWIKMPGSSVTSAGAARFGSDPDESIGAHLDAIRVPTGLSDDDLRDYLKSEMQKDDGPATRFSVIERRYELVERDGRNCVQYNLATRDERPVRRSSRKGAMILDIDGLACRHPQSAEIVVMAGHSIRHELNVSRTLEQDVEAIFASLRFRPLPQ